MTARVLLVEDDRDVRAALGQALELAEYHVTLAGTFIEATDHLNPGFEGVVVTDMRMPGKDGMDLIERTQSIDPELPVIVLTGEGDVPMAVTALQRGAYDFLEKPCPSAVLIATIERAWTARKLVLENRVLRAEKGAMRALETAQDESLSVQIEMVEKLLLERALRTHKGRVGEMANTLGLPRKTLYDKLKRHDLNPGAYR